MTQKSDDEILKEVLDIYRVDNRWVGDEKNVLMELIKKAITLTRQKYEEECGKAINESIIRTKKITEQAERQRILEIIDRIPHALRGRNNRRYALEELKQKIAEMSGEEKK